MPLDVMAETYECKTKTLYPYENFGLDSYGSKAAKGSKINYREVIGNLKIEDVKSSPSNKLPTQEKVEIFNNENRHKIGRDLIIEYLQNNVEILDYCMN